jgi:tight adherence protein C
MTPAVLLVAFFLFVLVSVGAAGYVFVLRPSRTEGDAAQIPAPIALDRYGVPGAQAAVADVFRLIGEAIPGSRARAATEAQLLAAAGYRWPSAASIFLGIKCACALLMGAACAWAVVTFRGAGVSGALLVGVCGLGFGYLFPDRVLERLAAGRSLRLRRALPSAIDLMVLAIEAGQGLDAAVLDAGRGLRVSHPDLASEFAQLHLELRANTSRVDALRNFADRSRDQEVRKFAALMIDTDRYGTSLGPALRTHSRYLRTRFRQSAQERARKVAVKLIFPVFFLIFPSVILVTLGPAAILIFAQMRRLVGE